jgi:hypothetical protein
MVNIFKKLLQILSNFTFSMYAIHIHKLIEFQILFLPQFKLLLIIAVFFLDPM